MINKPDTFSRLKWRWLEQIMHDPRLSPWTRVVGYEIARHLNAKTGDAWPSQETIRKNLSIRNITQVKRAIAALRALLYLEIVHGERGESNRYIPRFDLLPAIAGSAGIKTGSEGGSGARRSGGATKDGGGLKSQSDSGCSASLTLEANSVEKGRKPKAEEDGLTENELVWLSVKNVLAALIGPDVCRSWFDGLRPVFIGLIEVVMVAPSRFIKNRIEERYAAALAQAWRCKISTIEHVRFTLDASKLDSTSAEDEAPASSQSSEKT